MLATTTTPDRIKIDRIEYGEFRAIPISPITAEYAPMQGDNGDGYFLQSSYPFDIVVWGDTKDECLKAFSFMVHSLWLAYAEEIDDNMTVKAQQLAHSLRTYLHIPC